MWPTDAFDMKVINSRGLYYTVVSALLFAIPLLIMILAYTAIIIKLRRSNKSGVNEVNNNSQKAKTNSRKKVGALLNYKNILKCALDWGPTIKPFSFGASDL